MPIPDRIERTLELAHPVERVWDALTSAEGLGGWFGTSAEVDLRPGGEAVVKLGREHPGPAADPGRRAAAPVRLELGHRRAAGR